jgi:hypothetical protein
MGYTTYTCTHCSTYTYKGNYVNALGHDMDDGVMTVKPTFTSGGKMTYTCKRTDCGYSYDEDLAIAWYRDYETLIGADDVTLTEEFVGTTDPVDSNSSKDKIFDGLIMTNTWGANKDNYWKAPCGWVEDNDGDSSNNVAKGGKLTIDFKYEHYLTVAKFYIFANELGFTIKFYDGAENLVFELAKNSFAANPANEAQPQKAEGKEQGGQPRENRENRNNRNFKPRHNDRRRDGANGRRANNGNDSDKAQHTTPRQEGANNPTPKSE